MMEKNSPIYVKLSESTFTFVGSQHVDAMFTLCFAVERLGSCYQAVRVD